MAFNPLLPLPIDALASISIAKGSHPDRSDGLCALELVAWLAGEPHSAAPACACPVIAAFMIAWNDALPSNADRDRLLKSFLPRLVGSRSTKAVEKRRSYLALDWLVRMHTTTWLDVTPALAPHATALRALAPLLDSATAKASQKPTVAAGNAAWDAAWDAAGAAAWNAAGTAAGAALAHTVATLQVSALDLLDRMFLETAS